MNIMRKNIVVTGFTIAALVAAGGAPVYAQNTTGEKIEKKTEDAKDKAKTMGQEAKTGMSDSWITSKTKIALFSDLYVGLRDQVLKVALNVCTFHKNRE